jgi:hypothetical protein
MTRPLPLFAPFFVLAGCVADRDLVQPVAQARAEIAAEDARPAVQAALGLAGVGAAMCGYSLEDWQAMGDRAPELPEALAAWFSLEEDGVMRAYPARGQYEIVWSGGRFFGQDVRLELTVGTPMSAFSLYLRQAADAAQEDTGPADSGPDQDERESLASALLATSSCASELSQVTGKLSFPISGSYDWELELQGAEGDQGVAIERGSVLPARGALLWSGVTSFGRATLQTEDASVITEQRWPATASGRDWEAGVELDLARD